MTKLLTSAAFVAALIAAPAAFAATSQPAAAPAKPSATSTAHAKKAECVKEWKAQKKHTQSEKEFLKACEKA
ncbi:hypothetical protein [Caulobacter sp. 17J65-9]|uniref:hypothetical protein n=1 Tax=Caulobacter sp. 17J65-9 TaxID=2709382 RepID=UPI0013CB6198|nr:hypothetical protein [Caulobacter sp. 17J65-9]NEX92609.1 hypothetical protein [Caulobacter sp. 17J65-9]